MKGECHNPVQAILVVPSGAGAQVGWSSGLTPWATAKQLLWSWIHPGTSELPLCWEWTEWPLPDLSTLSGEQPCVMSHISSPTKATLCCVSSSESPARVETDPGFLLLSLLGLFAGDDNPPTLVASYIYGS